MFVNDVTTPANLVFFRLSGDPTRRYFAQDLRDVAQDVLGVLVSDDDQVGQRRRVEGDDVDNVADLDGLGQIVQLDCLSREEEIAMIIISS